MARIVVNTFVSLDGVMQAPGAPDEDRSGGFEHGGWTVPHWNDAMMKVIEEATSRLDGLLLGRGTYEIFAAHWPGVSDEDPIAEAFNRVPKYVVSRTLDRADWRGTAVIRSDAGKEIRALRERTDGEIQVHGSPGLLQTLIADGLLDELRLWIFPVVLGKGKRLFADGTVPAGLELVHSRTFDTGVVVVHYRPAGAVKTGTYGVDA